MLVTILASVPGPSTFNRTPHRLVQVNIGPAPSPPQHDPPSWSLEESVLWTWPKAEEPEQEDCFINTLVVGDHSCDYPPVVTGPDHLVSSLREAGRSPPLKGGSPSLRPQRSTQTPPTIQKEKPNLVMVHGYAAALGFYFRNYDGLAEHFNIFAIDQLGCVVGSRKGAVQRGMCSGGCAEGAVQRGLCRVGCAEGAVFYACQFYDVAHLYAVWHLAPPGELTTVFDILKSKPLFHTRM